MGPSAKEIDSGAEWQKGDHKRQKRRCEWGIQLFW